MVPALLVLFQNIGFDEISLCSKGFDIDSDVGNSSLSACGMASDEDFGLHIDESGQKKQ